jgi:TP901 family phage tail tape measure protein
MADLTKLVVRISADIAELKAGLAAAQGEVDKMASGVASSGQRIASSFSKVGSQFTAAGTALTAGLTLPIVALGGLALKTSTDFETAFAGVQKNVDGTAAEMDHLRAAILNMSTQMPASAKEIANVASAAGQLGVRKEDILDFTKTMIMLGTTTNMTADQAATAMAQFANVMQLPESDVEKLASVLVDLGKNGASTEAQIMDMASNIVGAAHTVGISAQDVLGFANAIASIGIEAQAGGTAISRVFMTLAQAVGSLQPDKEQLDAIAQAQRDVRDASDNMAMAQRGVRDAFEGVSDATRGLQNAYQGVADAQRSVRDASEGVAAAHRSTRDATEALAESHRTMRNATEGLADAQRDLIRTYRDVRQAQLDARRETLSVAEAYQGLKEVQAGAGDSALEIKAAQLALAQAHKQVADAAKKGGLEQRAAALAVEQAQQRLNAVQVRSPRYALDLQNAQLRLAEAQGRVGKSAEDYGQKELQASRNVRNAKEGVQDAAKGERNASEAVAAARRAERNASESLQAAQRALVATGANVEAASRALRNAHEGVTDAQKRQVRSADDLAEAQKALAKLQDPERLKKIAEVAGMTTQAFADMFKSDPAMATAAFIKGLDRMKAEGKDVFKVLDDLGLQDVRVQRTLLGLAGAGDLLTDSLMRDREEFKRNQALQEAYAAKVGTTAAQLQIMRNQLNVNLILLGDKLAPALLSVLGALQPVNEAFGKAIEIFGNLPKPVQSVIIGIAAFVAIVGPLLMVVGAMASGLGAIISVLGVLGISFAGGSIAVTGLAAAFGTLILAALPWIALAAAIVLAGYLIYKNWDTLKAAAKSVGDAIVGAFNSVLSFLSSNWPEVATLISGPFAPLVILATDAFGIRSAMLSALDAVVGFFRSLPGWILAALGDVSHMLYNVGRDIVNGMLKGIQDAWGSLTGWLGKAVDKLPGPVKKILKIGSPSVVFQEIGENIVAGLALGIKGASSLFVPAPMMADTVGSPGLPASTMAFIAGTPTVSGPRGGGLQAISGEGGGSVGTFSPVGNGGLSVEVNGPVKVINNGRGQDATGALGDLAFGVQGQLNRRGVYT